MTYFSVVLPGLGLVSVTVHGNSKKQLGQIVEDTLEGLAHVTLLDIMDVTGIDYELKKR